MSKKLVCLVIVLTYSSAAYASCPPALDKNAAEACQALDEANAELETTRQELVQWLDAQATNLDPKYREVRNDLMEAQRLWEAFKKADCGSVSSFHAAAGGQVQLAATYQCAANHAEARTQQLKKEFLH